MEDKPTHFQTVAPGFVHMYNVIVEYKESLTEDNLVLTSYERLIKWA